jgi:Hypothetical glycosyl hydrolase family 15
MQPVRSWWYGIGKTPTAAELTFAAAHYDLAVLNAWETSALRRLRALNPAMKVLVYKDFSSTRNYPGAVIGDNDAPLLPTGIGYWAAHRHHPTWFATDTTNHRIEWEGYHKHWQMAVWDTAYQRAWANAVTKEIVDTGWDGALADNDFNTLRWYSSAVLSGTSDTASTDRLIRDGLDALLATAGAELAKHGKLLIPNLSESRLRPGRWTAHARFGGAMEEWFALRGSNGSLLTFEGGQWSELRKQSALGETWLLLMTHAKGERDQRAGYVAAALLAGPRTCWSMSSTDNYTKPDWSAYQDIDLGTAIGSAKKAPSGAWSRSFTHGWVALNPTSKVVTITPPRGLFTLDALPALVPVRLPPSDAVVLTKST